MFLLIFLLLAFDQHEVKPCVVDQCDDKFCVIETPEGIVQVEKKSYYYEGLRLSIEQCPIWLIEPT